MGVAPALVQQPAPYEYDRTVPFQYQEQVFEKDGQMEAAGAGFQSPKGGKVNMIVVRPVGRGLFAGIVYQHGGGQSMATYLAEAEVLARAGAVSLILDAPGAGPGSPPPPAGKGAGMRDYYIALTVCYRRAIDYLGTLPSVDPARIAFVGHSYGAISGSALIQVEGRVKTFVLLGGVARLTRHVSETNIDYWIDWRKGMSPAQLAAVLTEIPVDPDNYVGSPGHGPVLIQCGNFDFVNIPACPDLYNAASPPKQLRWYDTDHSFADLEATLDRMQWLQKELRLKPVRPLIGRLWNAPRKRTKPLEAK